MIPEWQTETVKFPGGEFAVRGLSLADVVAISRSHADTIRNVFANFEGDAESAIADALVLAPELAVAIVERAADAPNVDFGRMPLSVQMDALDAVGRLTFVDEGSLGKTLEIVLRAVGAVSNLVKASTSG